MDWASLFIHDTTWSFVAELLVRCVLMYCMIVIFLRLTGKRGVRQLSIFEVAIILCLGSIAGDPMFTKDLPLIQALIIMSMIILLYRLTTLLMMKFEWIENLLEGKSLYIVQDGVLVVEDIKKGKYSHDEFFAEMRQQNTEHLGQIKCALLETDGNLSILFFPPEQIRYGLPLFPKACRVIASVEAERIYACTFCGYTAQLENANQTCQHCGCHCWTLAMNNQRLT